MRIGPPCTPHERSVVLGRLFQHDPEASRRVAEATTLAEAGEIDLSGLFAAWSAGEAVAAALMCVVPDGSALVWPPEVRAGIPEPAALATDVLRAMAGRADSIGCPFLQAAVTTERTDHRRALEASGFKPIARLNYLQHPLGRDLRVPRPPTHDRVTFTDEAEARFAAVVERTYAGSQDCPAFAGVRTALESLRSYRAAGVFTPERWQLIERDGRDLGVILVNDRPDERAREIVYLGIVPESRGRGLGSALVSAVLSDAAADTCDSVLAAADTDNRPALQVYDRLGFFSCGQQVVYIRRRPG